MGYNVNEILSSKWMSINDVPTTGVNLQILNVTKEAVGEMLEEKFAIHFNGGFKPLLANRTNLRIVSALHGADTGQWIGKTVNVYNDPSVSYAGRMTGGVRIRASNDIRQPHNNLPGHQDDPRSYQPQASAQQYRAASGAPIPSAADLADDIPF